ncbi:hypothetical protein T05_16454 [Trichinella murrelli]|uniref:Uncharacterized protein n=1 Tax=Trichinella murrelli TaxID=144512 RepID=A0A0V0UF30_9BILA|nr:hypothetical protein T05_16454 [Trichinella murrelli]
MIAYIRKTLTFYLHTICMQVCKAKPLIVADLQDFFKMTMLNRNFTSSKLKRIGVSRFDESINLNLARFVRALIEYSASNSNQLRSFETDQFLIKQTQTVQKNRSKVNRE